MTKNRLQKYVRYSISNFSWFGVIGICCLALLAGKPAAAGKVIYNYEGYWTTTNGPVDQDFTMNFNTATSGVAFFHWREETPSASGCSAYNSGGNPTVYIDGVPFEKINTTDYDVNGYNYYLAYASTTILSGSGKTLTIDTSEAPSAGQTCSQAFNLFILDDVVASSVLPMTLDRGSESGAAKDYAFSTITTAKNPEGLTGVMMVGAQNNINFTATSSMTNINDANALMFSAYRNIPALVQGRYDYGWSSFTPATYLYVYGMLFPYDEPEPIVYYYVPDITLGIGLPETVACCEGATCSAGGTIGVQSQSVEWELNLECGTSTNEIASGTIPAYTGSFSVDKVFNTPLEATYCLDTQRTVGTYIYYTNTPMDYTVFASTSPSCQYEEPDFCDDPCAGIATTTFGGDIQCGLQNVLAWSFCVSDNAISSLSASWEGLKTKVPLSIPYDLIEAINQGIASSTEEKTGFKMPLPSSTSPTKMEMTTIIDASSTEKTIGRENAHLFRQSLAWFIHLAFVALAALITIKILLKK